MKSKFIIIFFLSLVSLSNAQDVYLYTPNGRQVYAFQRTEMSANDIAYYNADCASTYPNAEILATATITYNCHSYAWNLTEGSTEICWLNQYIDNNNTIKNLHYYWEDSSYVETTEAEAAKIFYYRGDHSAIKSTTHAGKYVSKWGAYPLVRHDPRYGPIYYDMSFRRYYAKYCDVSTNKIKTFHNKFVINDTWVTNNCGDIDVQNVEVDGSTLILDAEETTKIQSIKVELGAGLKIQ